MMYSAAVLNIGKTFSILMKYFVYSLYVDTFIYFQAYFFLPLDFFFVGLLGGCSNTPYY